MYRQTISEIERRGRISMPDLRNLEIFWNQIMMEHAEFIRGLLDPTECELIETVWQLFQWMRWNRYWRERSGIAIFSEKRTILQRRR